MAVKYDSILNRLRQKDIIRQVDADPTNPKSQDAWVLKTGSGGTGGGTPVGLLLALTTPDVGGTTSYQFSYRTIEGTTIRTTLS